MLGFEPPSDQRPVTYFRGYPIHTATLLVIVHVAAFIGAALLLAFEGGGVLERLSFSTHDLFRRLAVWQPATYALVHSPAQGLWFIIEMAMLFMFGREVEKFFGRRDFLRLYAVLLLLAPAALALASLLLGPMALAGSGILHFGLFVAFAALYPGVGIFFGIPAKWVAVALFALYTLQALAFRQPSMLISLWVTTGCAILFVRHARGLFSLPALDFLKRRPRLSVVPRESAPRHSAPAAPRSREARTDRVSDEMDALLDKIGQQGLGSLSEKERARLEALREAMLRKSRQP